MNAGEATGSDDTSGPARPPSVLLVGYNGANNTGSEARLLSIIEDVRAVLGEDARVTIPTLNEDNLRRYISETDLTRVAPIPSIYFGALRRLVREHDLVLLVEGSCYMDTWTTALLWAFLWTTKQAARYGRPCLAYAVDSGHLSDGNRRRVVKEASKTDLIITRSRAAAERLRKWGVTAPMEVTADTGLTYECDPADADLLRRTWPEAAEGAVTGIAPVDFYCWPVVVRPFGSRDRCYRWPYYFSRSRERTALTAALARGLGRMARSLIDERDHHVALLCMEQLDEPIANMVAEETGRPDRVRVFSSRDHSASEMCSLLRSLDMLVSSRYHGCLLSLPSHVPMVALGHDPRTEELFKELGIYGSNYLSYNTPAVYDALATVVERVLDDPSPTREALERGHAEQLIRAKRNRELLRAFVDARGWSAVG